MPLKASSGPIVGDHDVVLLDLDGVVYLGADPVPGAAEAIGRLRAAGHRVAFVTNNASLAAAEVARRLESVGVPAALTDVVTSAQAAAVLLAARLPAGAAVLVLGAPSLADEVAAVGLSPVSDADSAPQAVVNGYSDQLCYADFCEAGLALRAGAWWVATNLDATIPTARGLQPGNGAITALLEKASGRRPVSAGKPHPPLLTEAVRRTGACSPLFVGDRLDTDIAGAAAAGMDSALVLTGVADPRALLAAGPTERPTYLAGELGGLLEPHPLTRCSRAEASCRTWRAFLDADVLRVRGQGDPLDGVRAAAALAWAYADRAGHAVPAVDGLPGVTTLRGA